MNFFAIILAAIVSMALGFLWYSPILLGTPWMKLRGYTPKTLKEAQKKMGGKYVLSLIAAFVSAYVLAWVAKATVTNSLIGGAMLGFLMWLGFTTTVQLTGWIFSDNKKELYFIDTGYQLVSLILMGAIIGMWQ